VTADDHRTDRVGTAGPADQADPAGRAVTAGTSSPAGRAVTAGTSSPAGRAVTAGTVGHGDRVDAAGRELGALVDAVAAGDLAATVTTCPQWTVADLAVHVGQFCGFWTHVLCDGTGRQRDPYVEVSPDDPGVVDWLRGCGDGLVAELRATPADTEVWTWYEPDRSAGFVARRCAHELAVHRYDAQSARGTCQPIEPPALAVDGIEEMTTALLASRWTAQKRTTTGGDEGRSFHLHGTDDGVEGAEWLVTLHTDGADVARVHAKGDLALRGAVSDLELLLYGRPTLGPVERFGDESVLDAWYRSFTF
jgi:uncharacterized protein (TIGR03083 family)